ncbi:hypothetical protein J6590_105937, partial [Homalodisca vitripennis]
MRSGGTVLGSVQFGIVVCTAMTKQEVPCSRGKLNYGTAAKQQSTERVDKDGPTDAINTSCSKGQPINGEYILVLKEQIKDRIPKKAARPRRTLETTANTVLQFPAKKRIETVPHPPYSPDLAPNDFVLYHQAKKEVNGRRFPAATAAIKTLEAILKVLSKEGFEHVFKEWQRR